MDEFLQKIGIDHHLLALVAIQSIAEIHFHKETNRLQTLGFGTTEAFALWVCLSATICGDDLHTC